jgi:hypothetical protein
MLTIFQMTTNDDWVKIARPVGEELPFAYIYFMAIMGIGCIGIMNLSVAIFLEALVLQTKKAEEKVRRRQQAKSDIRTKACAASIQELSQSRKSQLPVREVFEILERIRTDRILVDAFAQIGAPVDEVQQCLPMAMPSAFSEQGALIDVHELLCMAQTQSLPILRSFIADLGHQIQSHEEAESRYLDKVQATLEVVAEKIAAAETTAMFILRQATVSLVPSLPSCTERPGQSESNDTESDDTLAHSAAPVSRSVVNLLPSCTALSARSEQI